MNFVNDMHVLCAACMRVYVCIAVHTPEAAEDPSFSAAAVRALADPHIYIYYYFSAINSARAKCMHSSKCSLPALPELTLGALRHSSGTVECEHAFVCTDFENDSYNFLFAAWPS